MKMSDQYKQDAKEMFVTGIVLLVIGLLWLTAIISLSVAGVKMNIGPIFAAAPCLIFFAASAWAIFVEYPWEKRIQKIAEEEETQEVENQRQVLKN